MARKPVLNTSQVWLRVIVLVLGLGGVIYSMKSIRQNSSLDTFFTAQKSPKAVTSGALNLCPTRVARIEIQDMRNSKNLNFYQNENKWVAQGEQTFELEPLFVEKWLGEFCDVKIDKFLLEAPQTGQLQEITFKYIDGTAQQIKVYENAFFASNEWIESDELKSAVQRLNP